MNEMYSFLGGHTLFRRIDTRMCGWSVWACVGCNHVRVCLQPECVADWGRSVDSKPCSRAFGTVCTYTRRNSIAKTWENRTSPVWRRCDAETQRSQNNACGMFICWCNTFVTRCALVSANIQCRAPQNQSLTQYTSLYQPVISVHCQQCELKPHLVRFDCEQWSRVAARQCVCVCVVL